MFRIKRFFDLDLQNVIGDFKPKQKVVLEVERNKKEITLVIVLADRSTLSAATEGTVLGGLKLTQINDQIIQQFRLPRNFEGVMVRDVEPKSKAEKVGFQAGDVIIQIEDIEIKQLSDVDKALKQYNKANKRIYVNRFGQTILFVIQ